MAVVFAWKNRSDPQIRFALAAVLGPWLMFEIVRTKLPHYMLPTFPPLAFLTADAIVRCLRGEKDDLHKRAVTIAWAVVGLLLIAIGVGAVWAAKHFGDALLPPIVLTGVAVAFAVSVFVLFARKQPRNALLAMGLGMLLMYGVLFGGYLPRADFLRVSSRAGDILIRAGAIAEGTSEMLDYKEPSLAFYQGGTIRENSAMTLTGAIVDGPASWWVITDEVWAKTPADVKERLETAGSVSGLAYADGRVVNVLVVRERKPQ
jgi:4-amino-4-deoxy-L-arabinose transferase-like glycosyltransferase